MKTYDVIIRASIIKTITVTADNEEDAYVAAHDRFTTVYDDYKPCSSEHYEQDTLSINEVVQA